MLLFILLLFQPSDTCIKNSRQYSAYFGAKPIINKEQNKSPSFTIKNSTDSTVTYKLYNKDGLTIDLYRQFTTLQNDFFIVNGKKLEFLKSAPKNNGRLIIDQEIGMFNLESSSSSIVKTMKGKYFIFKGSVQGAAGNMSSLRLFFVVDFTKSNNIKYYHLQNWAPYEYSFFDFNNDGYLDYSFFRDLKNVKNVEITNYSLVDYKVLALRKKNRWKGLWGDYCLYIR